MACRNRLQGTWKRKSRWSSGLGHGLATWKMRQRSSVIFVPFIGALGGVERLILTLADWLHDQRRACRLVCFKDTVGLGVHARCPLTVCELQPARNFASEAHALARCLRGLENGIAGKILAFDLK